MLDKIKTRFDLLQNEEINKKNIDTFLLIYTQREEFLELMNKTVFSNLIKLEWIRLLNKKFLDVVKYNLYINKKSKQFRIVFFSQNNQLDKLMNLSVKSTKYNLFKVGGNLYWGFVSIWKAIKIWIFSLFFVSITFYVLLVKRACVLPQTLFFWVGLTMLLYWLLSGFVFFVKKYQFSRYTSVIQRFWRRTYILFWLIESGLLLVFFYLVVNSSQESFYMFDQGYFLKSHLFSWKIFIFKSILVVSLITYSYLTMLNLKWNTFNKNIINLIFLTTLLLYFVWTEFYQIYWVSNFYANFFWLYDFEDSIWTLEWDARRTRILNHYVMILFLLKFWHIVFILACWIFFLLRSNELDIITYPLFSFNFQNFIILFLMMWLFMYPWFKHTFHWLAELPYYWFYVDTHIAFFKIFVNDVYMFYNNLLSYIIQYKDNVSFKTTNFININLFDHLINHDNFIKHTIKDLVILRLI